MRPCLLWATQKVICSASFGEGDDVYRSSSWLGLILVAYAVQPILEISSPAKALVRGIPMPARDVTTRAPPQSTHLLLTNFSEPNHKLNEIRQLW